MATPNYLRHHERESLKEEKSRIENVLEKGHSQQPGSARREIRRIEQSLDSQTPKEMKGEEKDSAVRREAEIRDELVHNMPSQEEMRRCPPGAIGKHREYEKRYKNKIIEWKNLRIALEPDSDDPDLANLERYRPSKTPQALNMDNAQIPGKTFSMPSERFKAKYDEIDWKKQYEDLDAKVNALMEAQEARAEVPSAPAQKKKPKRKWSDQQRAEARERMLKRNEKKRQEREAAAATT